MPTVPRYFAPRKSQNETSQSRNFGRGLNSDNVDTMAHIPSTFSAVIGRRLDGNRVYPLVLLGILFTPQVFAQSRECSAQVAVGSCDQLKRAPADANGSKDIDMPTYNDGSAIYNDFGVGGKPARKAGTLKVSPTLNKRAEELTKKARDTAKALVIGDVRSDSLTAEQKAMAARLDSVKISVADGSDKDCQKGAPAPNARYEDSSNSVIVCPSAARLAPAALLMVVTHEFGHVISPCVMAKQFYDVDPKLASSARSPQSMQSCLRTQNEREIASDLFTGGQTSLPPDKDLRPEYKAVVSKLKSCNLLKVRQGQGGIERSSMFKDLQACLDRRYGQNFERFTSKKKAGTQESMEAKPSLQCYGVYEEHFADAFGARVFGKILEDSKGRSEDARIGLVEMASYTCSDKGRRVDPGGPSDYPPTSERLLLQMADPETQTALGCILPAAKTPLCTLEKFRPDVGPVLERAGEQPSSQEAKAVR